MPVVPVVGIATVRAVIPPRVAEPDPDSETEVVTVATVVMVAAVVVAAMMATEVTSMPTSMMSAGVTTMPAAVAAVPTTMPATGESDRRPADRKRDTEDNHQENLRELHGNLHPRPKSP
ncbi:MAG: hypothetical protein ACREYC_17050 [Gammaproteobacteria bacterium]